MTGFTHQRRCVLMLSSGQRPRYRDDIIRVMALPTGGRLQFRYRKEHIPDEVFDELAQNHLSGSEALVAYLDTSNQGSPPEIVPCRFARVLESEVEGEFAVIHFEVGEFATVAAGTDVKEEVDEQLSNGVCLPNWKNGNLEGHFLIALEKRPDGLKTSLEPRVWQKIVSNLGARQDFQQCPFFYRVRAVLEEGDRSEMALQAGKYVLKPDRTYQADIVHYTPSGTSGQIRRPSGWLHVDIGGGGVGALTTQRLPIDSPYDVKRVYFRATGQIARQYGLVSFSRETVESNGGQATKDYDFEVVLEIGGAWKRQLTVGGLIALFLALPKLADSFAPAPWVSAGLVLLSAVVTAGLLVFGLRKVP